MGLKQELEVISSIWATEGVSSRLTGNNRFAGAIIEFVTERLLLKDNNPQKIIEHEKGRAKLLEHLIPNNSSQHP